MYWAVNTLISDPPILVRLKSPAKFSTSTSENQSQINHHNKMAPSQLQQRRTHNTLLFQKLLNLRDGASPFTLVLDTLEQSGAPVVREFVRRAKVWDLLCTSDVVLICYLSNAFLLVLLWVSV